MYDDFTPEELEVENKRKLKRLKDRPLDGRDRTYHLVVRLRVWEWVKAFSKKNRKTQNEAVKFLIKFYLQEQKNNGRQNTKA